MSQQPAINGPGANSRGCFVHSADESRLREYAQKALFHNQRVFFLYKYSHLGVKGRD